MAQSDQRPNGHQEPNSGSVGETKKYTKRTVQNQIGDTGTSLSVNVPKFARDLLKISEGDEVGVEICERGIIIDPDPENGGNGR